MKKCFSRYRLALFTLSLIACPISAKQYWSGSHVHNVKNEDLVIQGDVVLPAGGTRIEAIDRDVTIHIKPKEKNDTVYISAHAHKDSQLYLRAYNGNKIRVIGKHNLEFVGSSESDRPLLIIQSGNGLVDFKIKEGKRVAFNSRNRSGGTEYYVVMGGNECPRPCRDEYSYEDEYCYEKSPCHNEQQCTDMQPTLLFSPLHAEKVRCHNTEVLVGKKSVLSYLSSNPIIAFYDAYCSTGDTAEIRFDAASTSTGRMVLKIANGGAFVVAGSFTTQNNPACITLHDIKRSIAAGHKAMWAIENSLGNCASSAGLLVENKNKKLGELLIDPFGNLRASNAIQNFKGMFSGKRYGAIIGANGALHVDTQSYLDYVGLSGNITPHVKIPGAEKMPADCLLKARNASALFIDGNNNPCATPAQIYLKEQSALFFRSGVGNNGKVRGRDHCNPFTVTPDNRTCGTGNIVFDVEGELWITGAHVDCEKTSKIEVLSLEVAPTGGSLFVCSPGKNFPLRTFATEDGELLRYNSAAFLINNLVNLTDTVLNHTDENHIIIQENDIKSEPTYIGGERTSLDPCMARPAIRFGNSDLQLHTSAAVTGVDLVVPNLSSCKGDNKANVSQFIFYANSPEVDNGTGRQLVLGTQIGAFTANNCGYVNGDAHLDIIQEFTGCEVPYTRDIENMQTLLFSTAENDTSMHPLNNDPIRPVIQTVFLGNSSNISVGRDVDFTPVNSKPTLLIDGNFFSFTSKGGMIGEPPTSNITGKGGMFVDLNGTVSINPQYRASFAMMVTKGKNGIVNLPGSQVFFADGIGIADWKVNLSNPNSRIIVPADQTIADYTFNWIVTRKDFKNFVPYSIDDVNMCGFPAVTQANVTSLPVIQGSVDQLQIQGTRIGDPAQIMIDGGFVREVVFLNNNLSAEAPVAIITLQNEGFVGIGPADTSRDSLNSTTTLGVNGVTIIANGSGQLELNSDLLVNNVCAFVKGPDFAEGDVFVINTTVPREIRIKSGGVLDLRSFDQPTDLIRLIGSLGIFLEAGATIIMGGGILSFAENTKLQLEAAPNVASFFNSIPLGPIDDTLPITIVDASQPHNELSSLLNFGNGLHNTDAYRVRLIGQGTIDFTDNAQAFVPANTFIGVETFKQSPLCEIPLTDITLSLRGNASFIMGHLNNNEGGVLQIGNVEDLGPNHSVNFTLSIDGTDANFFIGSYGFFGLGVGIERYDGLTDGLRVANDWLVDNLFNLGTITFNFQEGQFTHDRAFTGDDPQASLLAIGGSTTVNSAIARQVNQFMPQYSLLFNQTNPILFELAGGGNMALINPGVGAIAPIVRDVNGMITDRLTVGIIASSPQLESTTDLVDVDGLTFFDALDTNDAFLDTTVANAIGQANAGLFAQEFDLLSNQIVVSAVINGAIVRFTTSNVLGLGAQDAVLQQAVETGAVFINIDPTTQEVIGVSSLG